MLRCMEHYLCLSSSAATKQLFPSQLGTMNIGPSMLRSAISIITSDVHMRTGLSLLVFYLYPKVFFSILVATVTVSDLSPTFFISWQGANWDCWVPPISPKAIPRFVVSYVGITSRWWKEAGGFSMSRRTLSTYHLGYWTVYSRLPRAGVVNVRCTRLVLSVSHPAFKIYWIPHLFPCRCQGSKKDLDGELSKYPRSREFTEELVKRLPVMTLWKNFGIIPDVVVSSHTFFPGFSNLIKCPW